ncbi:MAG: hypothetical protein O7G83_09295, partial [Proteobacteria bacterium]|nr:hypothetical protein [Pseudomonadota bacterium]
PLSEIYNDLILARLMPSGAEIDHPREPRRGVRIGCRDGVLLAVAPSLARRWRITWRCRVDAGQRVLSERYP